MKNDKTVMIVDDSVGLRDVLSEALILEGYNVLTAGNGIEAMTLLVNKTNPNIILLDIMMPMMDGRQFLAALRRNASFDSIPVIVTSGSEGISKPEGASAFVEKPFILKTILDILKVHCS